MYLDLNQFWKLALIQKTFQVCCLEGRTSVLFQLYKNVFCPDIGHTVAFIGFVEPASGAVLPMSEIQSRWFAELTQGNISLPGQNVMNRIIDKDVVSLLSLN